MSPHLLDFEQIDAYAAAHSTPLEPLLAELDAATHASLNAPQMLSGPVVGRLLRTLAWLTHPRLILEIGTYSGYSALAMAPALAADGRLVTCEVDEEHAAFAQSWFDRSEHGARIELRRGPALETVRALAGPLDFVFIDADKGGYVDYYEAVVPKLAPGGLIAVDNSLRGGAVITDPESEPARVMQRFNSHVQADPRTENVLLSVRDGVTVARLA
ncbi:MAG: O-methyltransferase [Solirubrobacteraceae bacterium]